MVNVCVLRSGGEYTAKHVQWLAKQVPGLVCLSDVTVPGVPTKRLRHTWPKWWAKIELFSGIIDDDLMYYDLDTVVLEPPEEPKNTTALADFYRPHLLASGLMFIKQQDKRTIYEAFLKCPSLHMAKHQRFPLIGDQGFLNGKLQADRWQDVAPGQVVSYKVDCQHDLPEHTKVVCFHGQPRPWHVKRNWIPCY
jgi:hypothetical protein